MSETPIERLLRLESEARGLEWSGDSQSVRDDPIKVRICAEMSALVYEELLEFEIKRRSRVHLFGEPRLHDLASHRFAELRRSGAVRNLSSSLGEQVREIELFVIAGRLVVILGAKLGKVLFLAVRGTILNRLWDWRANVDVRKYRLNNLNDWLEGGFFHRGFFEAVSLQLQSVGERIARLPGSEMVEAVVWTGHSLGGAMAAIGLALTAEGPHARRISAHLPDPPPVVGAYTFGMPRYCGLGSALLLPGPRHVFRENDLVPKLPPRRFGFVDCPTEYSLLESGELASAERTDSLRAHGRVWNIRNGLREHAIEGYVELLAKQAPIP